MRGGVTPAQKMIFLRYVGYLGFQVKDDHIIVEKLNSLRKIYEIIDSSRNSSSKSIFRFVLCPAFDFTINYSIASTYTLGQIYTNIL